MAELCHRRFQHTLGGGDSTDKSTYHRTRRREPIPAPKLFRKVSDDAKKRSSKPPPKPPPEPLYRNPPTIEEFRGLVDIYDRDMDGASNGEERETAENNHQDEQQERYGAPESQRRDINDTLEQLLKALQPKRPNPDVAFQLYKSLPYPRVAYLDYKSIRKFLNCLAWVEWKKEASMMRYLSVIDDMKSCAIPIALADWSTAIHFVGRCFSKVGESEVESSLYIWREMEQEAGVRGNRVTFSILFDIASKAGKHRLAEMILREMGLRKLKLDRHFHTSLIYHHGLRGDGDAVRKAYVNLVDSGAIVDTSVLNCVISSLINAGEPPAAEQVFAGMKDLHHRGEAKTAPSHWSRRREIGKMLTRVSVQVQDPEQRALFQKAAPVGPDHATYKILINYHTSTTGNIDRISELLSEMSNDYQITPRGDIYYALFIGFINHGGIPYSSWTLVKLEELWASYRNEIYNGKADFFVDKAIAKAVLRAFERVIGGDRTWEAWEELKSMWKSPSASDFQEANDCMMTLLQKRRGPGEGVVRWTNRSHHRREWK